MTRLSSACVNEETKYGAPDWQQAAPCTEQVVSPAAVCWSWTHRCSSPSLTLLGLPFPAETTTGSDSKQMYTSPRKILLWFNSIFFPCQVANGCFVQKQRKIKLTFMCMFRTPFIMGLSYTSDIYYFLSLFFLGRLLSFHSYPPYIYIVYVRGQHLSILLWIKLITHFLGGNRNN